MRRRDLIALLGGAMAAVPWQAGADTVAAAVNPSMRLAGAWRFVSSINTRADGSRFERWGPDATGMFMFDAHGHYSQIIMSPESWVFGAKSYFSFGGYTVDEAGKIIETTIKGSSLSRLIGTTQIRKIVSLSRDELKYINPMTASGTTAEVVWRRMT